MAALTQLVERLLRVALQVLLWFASASGLHTGRAADHVRVDEPENG